MKKIMMMKSVLPVPRRYLPRKSAAAALTMGKVVIKATTMVRMLMTVEKKWLRPKKTMPLLTLMMIYRTLEKSMMKSDKISMMRALLRLVVDMYIFDMFMMYHGYH
jgi:hypothetical protein